MIIESRTGEHQSPAPLFTSQISNMDFGPQQIGKLLILIGLIIVLLGALFLLLGHLGLFKLPGDLQFGSKNWRVFIPITSCLIISIVLTLLLWLISYLRR
ncbi:MAG: DUF2905 domain-containing protein [Planctomycetota bacterium]